MSERRETIDCQRALDLIESDLDEEVSNQESTALESHVRTCGSCAKERELAARLAETLRELPLLRCPERLVHGLSPLVSVETRRPKRLSRSRGVWASMGKLPRLAAAALVLLAIVGGATWGLRPAQKNEVTPAQLARAREELQWTLAYLTEIGHRTGAILQDEVLARPAIQPVLQPAVILRQRLLEPLQKVSEEVF